MRAVVVGEGMLEMARTEGQWQLGYGGDMLNTAVHLARRDIPTAFLTALGEDGLSADLIRQWRAEGIDTSTILTHPSRIAGLYAIETDAAGERSFAYWRSESAARAMFACAGMASALEDAETADLLLFSLITLAILPPEARDQLLGLARRVRERGGTVAFDGNYRARLWQSLAEARSAHDAAIAVADIGLPTLDDEIALGFGQDADTVAAHWQGLGCREVVVKLGAQGCRLPDGTQVAPRMILTPVDTSGAGDAFNAGFLAARLNGATLIEAAQAGHDLAGWTIMRPGAIPPRDS